jgi:hypothetical protein
MKKTISIAAIYKSIMTHNNRAKLIIIRVFQIYALMMALHISKESKMLQEEVINLARVFEL